MSDLEQKARDIMGRIRHQVFTPEVTTMGNCPKCGGRSRSAGVCAHCLGWELGALVGDVSTGLRYTNGCVRLREVEIDVLRRAIDVLRRAEALAGGDDGRG